MEGCRLLIVLAFFVGCLLSTSSCTPLVVGAIAEEGRGLTAEPGRSFGLLSSLFKPQIIVELPAELVKPAESPQQPNIVPVQVPFNPYPFPFQPPPPFFPPPASVNATNGTDVMSLNYTIPTNFPQPFLPSFPQFNQFPPFPQFAPFPYQNPYPYPPPFPQPYLPYRPPYPYPVPYRYRRPGYPQSIIINSSNTAPAPVVQPAAPAIQVAPVIQAAPTPQIIQSPAPSTNVQVSPILDNSDRYRNTTARHFPDDKGVNDKKTTTPILVIEKGYLVLVEEKI